MRKEPVSLIWGASFTALFLFLLFLALIQFFLLRRSLSKNPPDYPLPPSVTAEEPFSVDLDVHVSFLLPGFRIIWQSRYSWSEGGRSLTAVKSLSRGEKQYVLNFASPLRGVYRGLSGVAKLEDLFGFFSLILYRGDPLTLHVCPGVAPREFTTDEIISGGNTATDEKARIRSEELLEVRKYYPGDDARRINWKMFAATGEMFLRIGEEIPPPSGEVLICLFPDSTVAGTSPACMEWCDKLVDMFLALVLRFSGKGCRVFTMAAPGDPFSFDPGKPERLLRVLAGITTDSPSPVVSADAYQYGMALPGAEGLKQLTGPGKGESTVFLVTPPDSLEHEDIVKTLLFNNGPIGGVLGKKRNKRIQQRVLEENISLLKRKGKGRVHVRIL